MAGLGCTTCVDGECASRITNHCEPASHLGEDGRKLTHARRYAASLSTYRALLGIRAVRAQSDSELVLEYDVPGQDDKTGTPASLTLTFDGAGKLEDAKVS